jgi:hypothetical protein
MDPSRDEFLEYFANAHEVLGLKQKARSLREELRRRKELRRRRQEREDMCFLCFVACLFISTLLLHMYNSC